jgi:hypothetical protein
MGGAGSPRSVPASVSSFTLPTKVECCLWWWESMKLNAWAPKLSALALRRNCSHGNLFSLLLLLFFFFKDYWDKPREDHENVAQGVITLRYKNWGFWEEWVHVCRGPKAMRTMAHFPMEQERSVLRTGCGQGTKVLEKLEQFQHSWEIQA